MVKYQRKNLYNMCKRSNEHMFDEDEESCLVSLGLIHGNSGFTYKNIKPKLLYIFFLSFVSCSLVLGLQLLSSDSLFNSFGFYKGALDSDICSSVANGTICCERSSIRLDICVMRGDVRTHSSSSSILLYHSNDSIDQSPDLSDGENEKANVIQHEKIRPYTRKWESNVMATIAELSLISRKDKGVDKKCDIYHDVPAVFFSTGGYTGNLYHEFNDGILPLYITSQRLNKKVVFVIPDYHNWWITKYGDILSQLSDFQPIDFSADKRIHCFPEAIVGLRIHNELSIDASLMESNKTIVDFHDLLDRAYWPRISGLIQDEEREVVENSAVSPSFNPLTMKKAEKRPNMPKLVIVSRNGSMAITNEDLMVKMAEGIGFEVEVLKPERSTELAKIYRVLNSSDVMIGVHGAAMTHFLFTKPGSVFIQVVPLGTDWASETYYGEPSRRLGLKYVGYKILPKESSLYDDYEKNDPILIDPDSVNAKGWEFTKKIYLDRQTVRLDLKRFRKHLLRAYYYTAARKNGRLLAR